MRHDLEFEDDGASWRIRRERQLRDMERRRARTTRFVRVMLVPPIFFGAVFVLTVLIALLATITGAAAAVDFSKPMYVMAGAPACPSADDVRALYRNAPNRCAAVKDDTPVALMEDAGAAGPYRVRILGIDRIIDLWVPYSSLQN